MARSVRTRSGACSATAAMSAEPSPTLATTSTGLVVSLGRFLHANPSILRGLNHINNNLYPEAPNGVAVIGCDGMNDSYYQLYTDDVDAALDAFVARREPRVAFVQDKTAQRIALVNRGASQRDLSAAMRLISAHLSAPI